MIYLLELLKKKTLFKEVTFFPSPNLKTFSEGKVPIFCKLFLKLSYRFSSATVLVHTVSMTAVLLVSTAKFSFLSRSSVINTDLNLLKCLQIVGYEGNYLPNAF